MIDFLAVRHRYRLVAPKIVDEAHFGGLFEREHLTRPVPMGPKSALRMRRFAASSPAERASLTASLYDLTRTIRRP